MQRVATVSTHFGNQSKVRFEHNRRDRRVAEKEKHIDLNREHEIWHEENLQEFYDKTFSSSIEKFNEKQIAERHSNRCITDYYNYIKNSHQKSVVYEGIFGIYDKSIDPLYKGDKNDLKSFPNETKKEILKEFYEEFQKKYGNNMKIVGAYYHDDELGSDPHLHIDFVPVQTENTRGLKVQNSQTGALKEMGFKDKSKSNTAQMQWEREVNDLLSDLCKKREIEVVHPMRAAKQNENEYRKHLETYEYKSKKTKELKQQLNEKENEIIDLEQQLKEQLKNEKIENYKWHELKLTYPKEEKIEIPETHRILFDNDNVKINENEFLRFIKQIEETEKADKKALLENIKNLEIKMIQLENEKAVLNKDREFLEKTQDEFIDKEYKFQKKSDEFESLKSNYKIIKDKNDELNKEVEELKRTNKFLSDEIKINEQIITAIDQRVPNFRKNWLVERAEIVSFSNEKTLEEKGLEECLYEIFEKFENENLKLNSKNDFIDFIKKELKSPIKAPSENRLYEILERNKHNIKPSFFNILRESLKKALIIGIKQAEADHDRDDDHDFTLSR